MADFLHAEPGQQLSNMSDIFTEFTLIYVEDGNWNNEIILPYTVGPNKTHNQVQYTVTHKGDFTISDLNILMTINNWRLNSWHDLETGIRWYIMNDNNQIGDTWLYTDHLSSSHNTSGTYDFSGLYTLDSTYKGGSEIIISLELFNY